MKTTPWAWGCSSSFQKWLHSTVFIFGELFHSVYFAFLFNQTSVRSALQFRQFLKPENGNRDQSPFCYIFIFLYSQSGFHFHFPFRLFPFPIRISQAISATILVSYEGVCNQAMKMVFENCVVL